MSADGAFEGRVVAITGGARGIGDAIARVFVDSGPRLVVLDKIEPDAPRDSTGYTLADVADPSSVAAAFRSIDAEEGRADVLVSSVGFQHAA